MYTVKILNNQVLAPETHALSLSKPDDFMYEPGQFIVLQTTINDKPVRRSYSLSSAPHQEELEVIIKAQPHGLVSPYLCDLDEGKELTLLGPFGHFTLEPTDILILISAGTGVAPFISYVRHLAHHNTDASVTLFTAYRHATDILLAHELTTLANTLTLDWRVTLTRPDETWNERTGRISKDHLSDLPEGTYYLCGPTAMVNDVADALAELGRTDVRTEKYGKISA